MKALWHEFKSFAFKGNMIDLAVAVVIGAAFGAVINSLVKHVLMPTLSYIIPNQAGYRAWHIGRVQIGEFIGEVFNFVIIALAVFLVIVKVMGVIARRITPPPAPSEPITKECPMCLMLIPLKARRCAHCTSDLPSV